MAGTAEHNLIYNNLFNNSYRNAEDTQNNIWNTTKTPGTNIIGGPYIGGNYWSDYSGFDNNDDGIGDTQIPYNESIDNGGDYLPLTYSSIYVDDDAAPSWYDATHVHTIQEGIDNASSGNYISVWNGTYNETVTVDKSVSVIGNCSSTVIINGSGPTVVTISAHYVNFTDFTVKGGTTGGKSGIKIAFGFENCNISNNKVVNNCHGVTTFSTNNNTITNNNISTNDMYGMYLHSSSAYNTVVGNHISNNANGIYCYSSSHHNIITDNVVSNNTHGIQLWSSKNNSLTDNIITNNTYEGIRLYVNNTNNTLENNIIYNNFRHGIFVFSSSNNNTIRNNSIYQNRMTGINVSSSNNNTIYNNYLNNTNNAFDNGNNTWNHSKIIGKNIVNGPYIGGNYWSDYTGIDTDHDGIGNTSLPYNNTGNITYGGDSGPLVLSPTVNLTTPINGSSGVSRSTNVVLIFSKSMNQTTTEGNITFSPSSSYTWSNNNKTLTINPSSSLSYSTTYTIDINWNATDEDGNVLLQNYSFSFTTESSSGGGPSGGGTVVYPPTADAGGPYSGTVGTSISFDGSGSSDEDGTIESYEWSFGDGSSGSGVNPTHTYTGVETFTVTLTVTDNDGYTDSDTATVTVGPVPPVAPTADADGPYVGVVNQQITLDGSGSSDSDGSIVGYEWSCGDESSVSGVNPTHMYTTAGTFDVTLMVTDDDGLTDNDTTTATVYDGESVDIPDGYVIDTDGDGTVDSYLNESSGTVTTMQETDDGDYLIDDNNDGTYDEEYDPATGGVTPYSPPPTPVDDDGNLWLYIAIIAIIGIIILIFILIKMGIIVI